MVDTRGLQNTGVSEQSQDIAPIMVFFASNDSSWVTGEALFMTNGLR